MSKIVGVTVGTALSPEKIKEKINPVLSVNGEKPDELGNVKCTFTFEGLTDEEKASLKGDDGSRGTGILKVTTAPSNYTTTTNGVKPTKRMSLSTIKSQSGVSEVLVGDNISHSYYLYHIYYVDETYAYMDTSQSIRGATGATGSKGADGKTPVKGEDYYTEADKTEMVNAVVAALPKYNGEVTTV